MKAPLLALPPKICTKVGGREEFKVNLPNYPNESPRKSQFVVPGLADLDFPRLRDIFLLMAPIHLE